MQYQRYERDPHNTYYPDKHGTAIKEGDILKYTSPKHPDKIYPLHVVIWKPTKGAFYTDRGTEGTNTQRLVNSHAQWTVPERWEIVGNVCDNDVIVRSTHPNLKQFFKTK